jgi:hypothetical protein
LLLHCSTFAVLGLVPSRSTRTSCPRAGESVGRFIRWTASAPTDIAEPAEPGLHGCATNPTYVCTSSRYQVTMRR